MFLNKDILPLFVTSKSQQAFIDLVILLSMFMLLFTLVILWRFCFWVETNTWIVVLFIYICIAIRYPIIEWEMVGMILTGLPSPYFHGRSKPGPGFPSEYDVVFLCVEWFELRGSCSFRSLCWEVVVLCWVIWVER